MEQNQGGFFENVPDLANLVLRVLWNAKREISIADITQVVNEKYGACWSEETITELLSLLIYKNYKEEKRQGLIGECIYLGKLYIPGKDDFEEA